MTQIIPVPFSYCQQGVENEESKRAEESYMSAVYDLDPGYHSSYENRNETSGED